MSRDQPARNRLPAVLPSRAQANGGRRASAPVLLYRQVGCGFTPSIGDQGGHDLDQPARTEVVADAEIVDRVEQQPHVHDAEGVGELLALPAADAGDGAAERVGRRLPGMVLVLEAVALLDEQA